MRTGKTEIQIRAIEKQLKEDKTILVAGLKSPEEYLKRLEIKATAEAVYSNVNDKILTGYKFKRV